MSNINAQTQFTPRLAGTVLALLVAGLALGACDNSVKRQFGLLRTAPDEFAVAPRAPLSMPPEFSLRAPDPGAPSLPEQIADEQTRTVVFGTDGGPNGVRANTTRASVAGETQGERSLLNQTGAQSSDRGIRAVVDQENAALEEANSGLIDRIIDYGTTSGNTDPNEVLVDPTAESRRLRENRALGLPVTEGETPEIEQEEPKNVVQNFFERLLGR